ncbi:MAG: hypothetical protein KC486_20425, partial [Myxococcales bacterium]|nr:hypothetical protein [Myxococcales bacterium]
MTPTRRLAALRDAAFNTARLPAWAVVCDLSTDVLAFDEERAAEAEGDREGGPRRLDAAVAATLGDFDVTVTPRGRVAEASIIRALVGPQQVVLANEVYVTAAWSIQREGARVVELPGSIVACPGRGPIESLDVDAAARRLVRENVACLWLTTPRVLLSDKGGAALELENLRELAALRDSAAPALPIVVDATKIGEWAARSGAPPEVALRALGGLADVLVLSARKDLGGVPRGLLLRRRGVLASSDQRDMFQRQAWAGEARHPDALARGVEG